MESFTILAEDTAILAANKLSPLPVQPEKSGDASLQDILFSLIRDRDGRTPAFFEAVHRIDRRSSGIVLFAKTKAAAAALSESFRENYVKKTYIAVVDRAPEPETGRLEHDLIWDPRTGKSYIQSQGEGSRTASGSGPARGRRPARPEIPDSEAAAPSGTEPKRAVLTYRVADRSERYVLLEIEPETGRSHQIRAQLAAIGLPIRGDLKYGARRSTKNGLIMLHARSMSFDHPDTGQPLSLVAPAPGTDPLWAAFASLAPPPAAPEA
jgi:23S rRNA pseudouridine1911/1915/1917 synthase